MSNEYKCAVCQGVFEKTWSDEEAMEEALNLYGCSPGDSMALLCDDCFKEFSEWFHSEILEEKKNVSG